MKLQYTTNNGKMTVEVEGNTQKELFKAIAEFQEVFEHQCTREDKTSENLKFRVRKDSDDNEYYEMVCVDHDPVLRGCKLAFGQNKKGGSLFPKKKDKDGNWLNNNGWVKYDSATGKET